MERNVAGGRGKVAVIVAAAVALTGLAALVARRLRQGIRLLFQQLVQCFLHATADQFPDLPLDHFLVQLYNFLGHRLLAPFECLCGNFILPEPASYVSFFAFFNLRNLLYIIQLITLSLLISRGNRDPIISQQIRSDCQENFLSVYTVQFQNTLSFRFRSSNYKSVRQDMQVIAENASQL